jgi:membrane associated rhomboid family serine protease
VIAYLAEMLGGGSSAVEGGGSVILDFGLFGPAVDDGEWYRIVTGGFLHAGLLHLGFNMFALYFLGRLLEPALGPWRFLGLYFVALLGGSFGALLLDPREFTVGASGAVFGLMAGAFIVARNRGLDDLASQIGFFVIINLVFTFSIPNISIGGHLGGLAAGGLVAMAIAAGERRGRDGRVLEWGAILALAVVAVVGCMFAAADSVPQSFG